MTIVEAVRDPNLFGPLFRDPATWQAWVTWLKAVFALPLTVREMELYRQCTGRTRPPTGEQNECYVIAGRRSGKSFMAALVATYLACFRDYASWLAPGEIAEVLVLAKDKPQAQILFRYIRSLLRCSPLIESLIARETAETIGLTNRVSIAVHSANFRSVRGVTLAACLCDEVAYWYTDGSNPDFEVLRAVRPSLATIPGSKLLMLSSPYSRTGVLFEAYQEYFGKDGAPALVWRADSRTMNPTLSEELIAREWQRDPDAAKAEWGGEFREDVEACFTRDLIEACVVPDRDVLPPARGVQYSAFVDPSGGCSDSFTLCIGHRTTDDRVVIDLLREWPSPFEPTAVVKQCSQWAQQYRVRRVTGDKYAGEWPREQFARYGITYEEAADTKSELYLNLLPQLTSRTIELPDDEELIVQLQRLERRKSRSGQEKIDHPVGAHDDVANAVAGVAAMLTTAPRYRFYVGGR